MRSDAALAELRRVLLTDPRLTAQPGWRRLALIFRVSQDRVAIEGFSFDSDQNSLPTSPAPGRGADDAVQTLHDAMRAEDPQHRAWLSCLLQISPEGLWEVEVEYTDDTRWRWNPKDPRALARELAELSPF